MDLVRSLAAAVLPPLCAACGRACRPRGVLCSRCARRLAAAAPLRAGPGHGLDGSWSSAPHEDVARDLVTALKFRRLLPVAELAAERIAWLAPRTVLSGAVVPVPTAPLRSVLRGFDPAAEIGAALSRRAGLDLAPCLTRRGGGRQVGRRRAERVGHPPRIHAGGEVPRSCLLVDDVLTTGSTMAACARALRECGASRVLAVTLTRRL